MPKHKAKVHHYLILSLALCFFSGPDFAAAQNNGQMPPVAPPRPKLEQPVNQLPSSPSTQSMSLQTNTQSSVVEAEVEKLAGPLNIIFLLDCSFSMKEKLADQVQKIEAAKQVLQNALARIPSDVNIGLRVFGQSAENNMPGGECMQTSLLVPLGQGNRRSIIEQVRNIRAFGMTPLEYALRMTAEYDFANAQGNKMIILVSDGADTCGGDPCRLIRMLPAYGIKLKVDVVGLNLKRDHLAHDQLNCVAEQSGGKYYDANSATDLIDSVSESVSKAITGRVLFKPGTQTNIPFP